jgi:hypothetical protein
VADTDPPETDAKKPVTRRRAPRKTSAPKSAAATSTAKPVAPSKPAPVAKPAPAAKPAAESTPRKAAPKPAPKPRSTKRSTPRPASARPIVPLAPVTKPAEKARGKWGAAAIFSGVAVAGAAIGALLTLRGSTPKLARLPKPDPAPEHAHQADGTDSSKSFAAGIADPGSVPE